MNKTFAVLLTAAFTTLSAASYAADAPVTNDPATATPQTGIDKGTAKSLKSQSDAQYKERGKVAEANEELNKGDCKASLDGSTKRACEKSAKAEAKSNKADAKVIHEAEKKAISDAKK